MVTGVQHNERIPWRALIAVALVGLWAAPNAIAKPIIMSPDPVFNFGEVDNDQKVKHDFVIKNAGDEVLEIDSVKPTCGCTVAEPATKTLEPGQETTVSVTLNLGGKQGHQQKRIAVISNDPDQPSYNLELTGVALTTILVEPNLLNFERISDSDPHTAKVLVKSMREGHTFTITDVTVSEDAPFKAEVQTITPGKEYAVVATTNPNLMAGALSGRMTIRTDDESRRAILVNVFGTVIGALRVSPPSINIQANSAPDARPAQMYLQVLPGRISDFELLEVIAPVEGMKAELIQRKVNDYHIKLTNMPVDESLKGKQLIVKTNLPEMPELRIPFNVRPERPVGARQVPPRLPVGRPGEAPRPIRPTSPVSQASPPAAPANQ